MVKIQINDKNIYFDGYLASNLSTATKVIKKDWDMIFIADGAEGSGKSVLIQQCAALCDPTLNINRITFTPEEFEKAVKSAKKFQAVIYDEAYTGLSSRATMSKINKALIRMLAEIRQKNLFIFIVCPTFFDLDKYVALWRSRALIHIYTGDNFQRGYFAFYNMATKKDLYVYGKKFYSYKKPSPNFRGRFTNAYVIDEQTYRDKKNKSLMVRAEKNEVVNLHWKEVYEFIRPNVVEGIKQKHIAQLLGVAVSTFLNYKVSLKDEDGENSTEI